MLGTFGRDRRGPRHSERADDTLEYLVECLKSVSKELFGSGVGRPAVRLQLEQVRQRLAAFALRQTRLVRDGWRIIYAEDDANDKLSCLFSVDDKPVRLVGRIDRIDFHEGSRTLCILDYKTADRAMTPEKSHQNGRVGKRGRRHEPAISGR